MDFGLFCQTKSKRTRRKGLKLHQTRFRLEIIKKTSSQKQQTSSGLPRKIDSPSLGAFKWCEDVDVV